MSTSQEQDNEILEPPRQLEEILDSKLLDVIKILRLKHNGSSDSEKVNVSIKFKNPDKITKEYRANPKEGIKRENKEATSYLDAQDIRYVALKGDKIILAYPTITQIENLGNFRNEIDRIHHSPYTIEDYLDF